jgi:hypothetical protein
MYDFGLILKHNHTTLSDVIYKGEKGVIMRKEISL